MLPANLAVYHRKKLMMCFFKLPILIAIPIYLEIESLQKEAVSPFYIFMQTFDFLIGINCFMNYNFLKKLVVEINYSPKSDNF